MGFEIDLELDPRERSEVRDRPLYVEAHPIPCRRREVELRERERTRSVREPSRGPDRPRFRNRHALLLEGPPRICEEHRHPHVDAAKLRGALYGPVHLELRLEQLTREGHGIRLRGRQQFVERSERTGEVERAPFHFTPRHEVDRILGRWRLQVQDVEPGRVHRTLVTRSVEHVHVLEPHPIHTEVERQPPGLIRERSDVVLEVEATFGVGLEVNLDVPEVELLDLDPAGEQIPRIERQLQLADREQVGRGASRQVGDEDLGRDECGGDAQIQPELALNPNRPPEGLGELLLGVLPMPLEEERLDEPLDAEHERNEPDEGE